MNTTDFCELFGDIRGDYLEEAQVQRSCTRAARKRTRTKRAAALIAACLCLLVSSATALGASDWGTQILAFFTDRSEQGSDLVESGYDLRIFIERFPISALTGGVREAGASIRQQYEDYQPYDSWYPGHWQRSFPSREAACAYIGLAGMKQPDLGLPETDTKLSVYGNNSGEILFLDLETLYSDGNMFLQFSSQIYTENHPEEITTGTRTTESVMFVESFHTVGNGQRMHVITSSALESGRAAMTGYLTDSGILYRLHISYPEKEAARARELLFRWAEQF